MKPPLEQLAACKLVPVIVLQSAEHAAPLADSLVAGGLPCAEVTFRTAAAAASIKVMAARGDLLVGAGTVLKIDQVKQAVDNGATFIVSPGFQPSIVSYCVEHGIMIVPGVSTATDICLAREFELELLKFFPAEAAGGIDALKAIAAPFGSALRFIPTGGITEATLGKYLAFAKVIACGGSWMVPDKLVAAGQFDQVTALVRQAVEVAQRSSPGPAA
jgi:2-dehydro-3-deoxyphosphogluconate aldolase/(4S)-4-hydroxy-2-oxoglutarate aldolase